MIFDFDFEFKNIRDSIIFLIFFSLKKIQKKNDLCVVFTNLQMYAFSSEKQIMTQEKHWWEEFCSPSSVAYPVSSLVPDWSDECCNNKIKLCPQIPQRIKPKKSASTFFVPKVSAQHHIGSTQTPAFVAAPRVTLLKPWNQPNCIVWDLFDTHACESKFNLFSNDVAEQLKIWESKEQDDMQIASALSSKEQDDMAIASALSASMQDLNSPTQRLNMFRFDLQHEVKENFYLNHIIRVVNMLESNQKQCQFLRLCMEAHSHAQHTVDEGTEVHKAFDEHIGTLRCKFNSLIDNCDETNWTTFKNNLKMLDADDIDNIRQMIHFAMKDSAKA